MRLPVRRPRSLARRGPALECRGTRRRAARPPRPLRASARTVGPPAASVGNPNCIDRQNPRSAAYLVQPMVEIGSKRRARKAGKPAVYRSPAPGFSACAESPFRAGLVQRQIEVQNIHSRFAEQADRAALGVPDNDRANLINGLAPSFRHALDLVLRRGRTDVRIQPAARGSYEVDRNRCITFLGMCLTQRLDSLSHGL